MSDTSRASSLELMTAKGQIDLLIPRGGAGLIKAVVENATVPVIETGTGICHVYVDQAADLDQALKIVANAKTSRPSVCNSAEVCLVHEKIAATFLPRLNELFKGQVQMRANQQALPYLPDAIAAGSQDFDTEFLDYIMAIKVVPDTQAAIDHINQHSTGHSEAIVTKDDSKLSSSHKRSIQPLFTLTPRPVSQMAVNLGSVVNWAFPLKKCTREVLWAWLK